MSATFSATIDQVTESTSKATVRTHTVLVDRAVSKGGHDLGPAGGEYMLVSLGGCFTSHLLAAIRANAAAMMSVRVAVTGTLDGAPQRFTAFTMDVTAQCDDADLARRLVTTAKRACQVVNTLSLVAPVTITYAGSPIDVTEAAPVG